MVFNRPISLLLSSSHRKYDGSAKDVKITGLQMSTQGGKIQKNKLKKADSSQCPKCNTTYQEYQGEIFVLIYCNQISRDEQRLKIYVLFVPLWFPVKCPVNVIVGKRPDDRTFEYMIHFIVLPPTGSRIIKWEVVVKDSPNPFSKSTLRGPIYISITLPSRQHCPYRIIKRG